MVGLPRPRRRRLAVAHLTANELNGVRQTAVRLAAQHVEGRVVILTGPAAHSPGITRFMSDAGARPIAVEIAELPTETRARFASLESALAHPTEETAARVNAADPDGTG